MVVHRMSNPKAFVVECEKVGVTYDRLKEAHECLGKQATARMFYGKSKRGGGGFVSAVSIENWMETLRYAMDHSDEEDHDPYQTRDIRPTEEWEAFVELIYQPIEEAVIESWKTLSNKKLGQDAKKYGMVVGTTNTESLKDIHERVSQMVDRRRQCFWYKKIETTRESEVNYSLLNIFQLREIAKELGISTNLKKEELITEIRVYREASIVLSYSEMTTPRLKLIAKERGLLQYNNLKKEELVGLLQQLDDNQQQEKDRITLGGIDVIARPEDGYINATQLCKAGGKEFKNWYRNDKVKEFLEELTITKNISISCNQKDEIASAHFFTDPKTYLIDMKMDCENDQRCTWVHPRVAIHIAQWISPKFAVIVTGWIHTLLATGSISIADPISAFSNRTEMDKEAEELEQFVRIEEYTTDSVIYVSYIGKGMLKVGFSDGRLLQRIKRHTSTESMYPQWRLVELVRVSGRQIEKMLHDFLYPYQTEFNKHKEIYKPLKGIQTFLEVVNRFIADNDLPMKIHRLEKRIYELELENALLKIK